MRIKLIYSLLFIAVLGLMMACNNSGKNEPNKISSEIVNNPVTASGENNTGKLPVFQFVTETHDFGAIIEGEKVSYTFKFKNTGGSDLVINSAKGSCGCTVPKWSKEPVAPGKEGEIEVIFDSSGKSGAQKKTVTITANTQPNSKVLTINSEVVTPSSENK